MEWILKLSAALSGGQYLDVLELREFIGLLIPVHSHGHIDHVGNPATFPSSTSLIVGPGFKAAHLPGYPTNPQSQILETDYKFVHFLLLMAPFLTALQGQRSSGD